jgi:hypothetical protein
MSQPWEKVAEGLPAELREQFRKTMEDMGASESYAAPEGYSEVRRRAAVSGAFDPAQLELTKDQLEQLYDESTVTVEAGRRLWLLNPGPRKEELRQLRPDELPALLSGASADPLSATLGAYLSGTAEPLERQTADQLLKTAVVSEWLAETPFMAPPPREVEARLGFEQLLRPFHELLRDGFSGRGNDLATLAEFVGAKPPPGWQYASMRVLVTLIRNFTKKLSSRPFVVHSPGGMGKSTLMAKFLLDHAKQEPGLRFPFAYLDFDRATLTPRQPLSMVNEIAKQVGHQFPELRGAFDALAARQREQVRQLTVDQRDPNRDSRLVEDSCQALRDTMQSVVSASRPFLLVLDTFEEVQQADDQGVGEALAFVRMLSDQGRWEPLRIVVAGRAPLDKAVAVAGEHQLGPFDEDAAVDLLARSIGAPEGAVPPRMLVEVYERVGGSPLALKLAASLLKTALAESPQQLRQTVRSFAKLDRSLFDRVFSKENWDSIHIAAQLYKRILEHIKDEDVKKLAHPGLVLRRITPELIQHVLAGACRLGATDSTRANALFDRLALQVSLVSRDGRVLTHRSDVRSLMLALIAKDLDAREPGSFARLNLAAADFHEKDDPAEALYHCLVAGEVERATRLWTSATGAQLKVTLDELPQASQILVKAKRLDALTPAESKLLTDATWTAYAEGRAAKLLADQQPAAATELLSRRRLDGQTIVQSRLTAIALRDMGELAHAAEAFHRGSELRNGPMLECEQLFREFGAVALWLGDRRALPVFEEALRLARELRNPMAELEALVGRAGALAREGAPDSSQASTEMFDLANRLGASAGQAPELLRKAVLFADRSMRGFTPVRFTYVQYLRASPIRTLNAPERAVLRKLLEGTSSYERLQGWLGGLDIVTTDPRSFLGDGSSGPAVEELQRLLKNAGHFTGAVDSVFGLQTRVAVGAFQRSKGLPDDGVVGPLTRSALLGLPADHVLAPAEELNSFLLTVLDGAPAAVIPSALALLIHRHAEWRLPAQQVLLGAAPRHQHTVATRFLETRRLESYNASGRAERARQLVDQADDAGRLGELLEALIPDHEFTAAFRDWSRFLTALVSERAQRMKP